ncbi:hemerythrin domain-containing protein [Thermopolyspora sp. NPDC052614]|uniref:hemerythrin domain-containing protein n=1 Tax=Thermopolyspora sp. NPDC052614 TaxID=3155682 RepID=UPI003413BC41
MPTDVIGLITADHRDVESLFKQIKAHPENRPALFAEACAKFLAHSVAEEERVYPQIARLAPDQREEVEHGAEEHHKAEEILFQLQKVDPDSPEFEQGLMQLVEAVNEHVQEEESRVLPLLAKAAPQELLMELGRTFSEGKAEVLRNPSAVTPAKLKQNAKHKSRPAKPKDTGKSKGSGQAKGGHAGADLSKEELYEKAKQADIPGRSQMSKDELAKAVEKGKH